MKLERVKAMHFSTKLDGVVRANISISPKLGTWVKPDLEVLLVQPITKMKIQTNVQSNKFLVN